MDDTTLSLSTLLAGSRDPDWQVEVLRHALHAYEADDGLLIRLHKV